MAETATSPKVPLVKGIMRILPDDSVILIGMKCRTCSAIMYPPTTMCYSCGTETVDEMDLGTTGKVWTYTVVHVSYGSICLTPPYVAAFIQLDDGGFVYAPLVECDPGDVQIGMPVEICLLKTGKSEEGETVIFAFKPVSR